MSTPIRTQMKAAQVLTGLDGLYPEDLDNDQLRDVWAACTNFTVWAGTVARRRGIDLHAMGAGT